MNTHSLWNTHVARQKKMADKRADDKRQRILIGAIKVFSSKGFHGSKVSDIAREAGVADGTIYLYFKNKDDILIQLFEESLKVLLNDMRKALAEESDPMKKIRTFIRMHLESVEKYQSLAEVMQVELRQSSKFMKEYTPKRFGEYLNIISETIRKGQEADLIRKDLHPAMIKRAIFGAMDEIALGWVLGKQRKRKSYELTECADKLSDIFLAGLVLPQAKAGSSVDKLDGK